MKFATLPTRVIAILFWILDTTWTKSDACEIAKTVSTPYLAAYTPVSHLNPPHADRGIGKWLTVGGPWYGQFSANREYMYRAASTGLSITAYLPGPNELYEESGYLIKSDRRIKVLKSLSERAIRSAFREQVDAYLNDVKLSNSVVIWSIGTEELRPWVEDEMRLLDIATDEIRLADPRQRPIFMYEPNNRSAAHMVATGVSQDLLVRGVYLNHHGWDPIRAEILKSSLKQMRDSVHENPRPLIPVLELSKDLPGYSAQELKLSKDKQSQLQRLIRHDVFLALIEGAQGIYLWSLYPARPTLTTYVEQVAAYRSAFLQIRGIANFLPNRAETENVYSFVIEQQSDSSLDTENTSFISGASFSYCGQRVLLLANSSRYSVLGKLSPAINQDLYGKLEESIRVEPFGINMQFY